jgi:hypothetical protein
MCVSPSFGAGPTCQCVTPFGGPFCQEPILVRGRSTSSAPLGATWVLPVVVVCCVLAASVVVFFIVFHKRRSDALHKAGFNKEEKQKLLEI